MSVPPILIACVGNVFLGDDGFGVEVARRLAARPMPDGVHVIDFGIRGMDLVYALLEGYEAVILVDALPRGQAPGTLYVFEPDRANLGPVAAFPIVEPHNLDPWHVLGLVQTLGGKVERVLLVGCEPMPSPPDDLLMELSDPVRKALDEAVVIIESLVEQIRLAGQFPRP